jgi:hypothetical protein
MTAITTATMAIIGGLLPPLLRWAVAPGRFGVPVPPAAEAPLARFDVPLVAAEDEPLVGFGLAVFDAALEAEPDFAALDLSAPAAFAPAVALFVPAWAAVDLSACLLPDDFGAPFVALADFEALAALLSWSVPLFEGASLRFSSLMWWRIPPVADSP